MMKTTTSTANRLKVSSLLVVLLSSALITASVSAQDSPQAKDGAPVSQTAAQGKEITAKIIREQASADMKQASDEREQRTASFPKLQPLLAKITDDMALTILEGLPHPFYNPDQLAQELKAKKTVTQHGFAFYQQAIQLSAEDKLALTGLLKNPASFKPFGGGKFCGGFHPDFSLQGEINGKPLEIQVCFGCQEIRAYHGEESIYADITEHAVALRPLLDKYHKQCPEPENEG